MTRALIYGGRDWRSLYDMTWRLNRLHRALKFTLVINGGQVSRDRDANELYGADWQAAVWAKTAGLPVLYFYANWQGEGKAAGPLRNQRMIDEGRPAVGIEFPGGRGTRDMRRRLEGSGIPVVRPVGMTPSELDGCVIPA